MGKPQTHETPKENGFKQPDRVDRHPRPRGETPAPSKPEQTNTLDETRKPKIVPWK